LLCLRRHWGWFWITSHLMRWCWKKERLKIDQGSYSSYFCSVLSGSGVSACQRYWAQKKKLSSFAPLFHKEYRMKQKYHVNISASTSTIFSKYTLYNITCIAVRKSRWQSVVE
jgi:hypothetical protein